VDDLHQHTSNNAFGYFTLKRFALADAAEVFVLLAGYAAGLVYRTRFPWTGICPTGDRRGEVQHGREWT
jgi:hypothetical protein